MITMKRTTFLKLIGGTLVTAGGIGYFISDKRNIIREDIKSTPEKPFLQADERAILYLASLAVGDDK